MPQDKDDIKGADAMKQAPTPGPLMVGDYAVRLEDHPLVKAGDVHRVTEMFRGGYLGFARPVGGEWNPSGWRKCDADGWMPWSGGENPVTGQNVEAKWRDGRVFIGPSDDVTFFDWRHLALASGSDIIAFRLAPAAPVEALDPMTCKTCKGFGTVTAISGQTAESYQEENIDCPDCAPVEASGSERDHRFVPGVMRCAKCNFVVVRRVFSAIDGTVGDGDNKTEPCPNGCGPLWPMTWEQNSRDMEERCEAAVLEAANLRAQLALRPQPSGETRKALDRLKMAAHVYEDDEMAADCATLEALLSARPAPVASGGQHSSGEDINWKSEWEAVSSLRIKDRAAMAQAVSEIVLDLKVRGYVSHDGDPNWCKEATAWEKIVVRNLSTIPAQPEALSEDDIRRRLIQRIEQWDGETEYDAEDIASLADDILHEFNGAPVLSWPALGYVSADAETALKAGINRVIYPAPSAHASFPLYSAPVPAQDDDKLRIAVEALERYAEQGYVGAQAALDKIGAPK